MTTEREATPPAGFDTHAEIRRMAEAGVSETQGAAMMYAALAVVETRAAGERREFRREMDAIRKDMTRDRENDREIHRKDMAHLATRVRLWIAISTVTGAGLTVGILRFLQDWPG